jgi:hypothetical protein
METPEVKASLIDRFKAFATSYLGAIIGLIIGAAGGYLYYRSIGCSTGACPITSNPWISVMWGAMVGLLIGSTFKKNKKKIQSNENEHGMD